jgi:hypothetical protein
MADRAGLVNAAGRENDGAFRQVLQRCSTEIAALALGVRNLVYDVLPSTVEVVWPTQGSVGWGIGPKKFSEQFAYFMPYARHVTLGFYHGGDLADPEGLLPDTGGKQAEGALSMRSMKIATAEQITQPALRALIEAAATDKAGRLKS